MTIIFPDLLAEHSNKWQWSSSLLQKEYIYIYKSETATDIKSFTMHQIEREVYCGASYIHILFFGFFLFCFFCVFWGGWVG